MNIMKQKMQEREVDRNIWVVNNSSFLSVNYRWSKKLRIKWEYRETKSQSNYVNINNIQKEDKIIFSGNGTFMNIDHK